MDFLPLLVPVLIFVAGIIVSVSCSSMGIELMLEARKRAAEDLSRTASYAEPFTDSSGRG